MIFVIVSENEDKEEPSFEFLNFISSLLESKRETSCPHTAW